MAEKITLKNMLANLPQKTDVDTVVGRDSSGNPVYIKKSDLAQVVAELIPIVSFTNNGVMSKSDFATSCMHVIQPHFNTEQQLYKICTVKTENSVYLFRFSGRTIVSTIYETVLTIRQTNNNLYKTAYCSDLTSAGSPNIYIKKIDSKTEIYVCLARYLSVYVEFRGGSSVPTYDMNNVTDSVNLEELELLTPE